MIQDINHLYLSAHGVCFLQESGHAISHRTAAVSSGEVAAGCTNSLVSIVRPKRPALSSLGRPVAVVTNHFRVTCNKEQAFHYDVDIKRVAAEAAAAGPDALRPLPQAVSMDIMKRIAKDRKWPPGWAFYGRKNLFTIAHILDWNREHNIQAHIDDGEGPKQSFNVRINAAALVNLKSLELFVKGVSQGKLPQNAVQCLEVALKQPAMFHPMVVMLPRAFFIEDPASAFPLGGPAEMWVGYNQSVRPCQSGLTLNVDLTAAAFVTAQPLAYLVAHAAGFANKDDLKHRPLSKLQVNTVNMQIRGIQIETTYDSPPGFGLQSYRRKYRVRALAEGGAGPANLKFKETVDGKEKETTVAQYYKDHHRLNLHSK